MRRFSLAIRLIVPAGLVALVALLAALEYRWLDQVSQADRDRRRATLQQRADDFAADLDRELLRIYLLLEDGGTAVQRGDWEAFARRYDTWHAEARDPEILRDIYFVSGEPDANGLVAYRPDARRFTIAAWPNDLKRLQASHASPPVAAPMGRGVFSFTFSTDPIDPSIPAVIATLTPSLTAAGPTLVDRPFSPAPRRLVGYLNREELQSTFLPALVARYFPAGDADVYRLEVVNPHDRAHPIFARGFAPGASIDPAHADASVSLFSLRLDLTGQVAQRTAVAAGFVSLQSGGSVLRKAAPTTPPSAPSGTLAATDRVQIVVTADGNRRPSDPVRYTTRAAAPGWQLILQHSAGSLDAAVASARRRNLWLSFGLLAVVAGGIVLIVTNARRAERLATQQMDFVAAVSHELRTPLAVIRAAAQNLSAGVIHDERQARQYGDLIETEGRRLTDMVEQVLEYAGLESSRRPLVARTADAGAVAREALVACQALVPAEAVRIDVEIARDLPPVMADEGAVRRAVQNLVTNAFKYGSAGGWIGLTVREATTRGRREIEIVVRDRGRGIDPADLPHIFEPFYRGRGAIDEQIHGNGLGLSLVKRIADAHGGRLSVASEPGEGAAFTLALPAADVDPIAHALGSSAPDPGPSHA